MMKFTFRKLKETIYSGETYTGYAYSFKGREGNDEQLLVAIAFDSILRGAVEMRHPSFDTLEVILWTEQKPTTLQEKQLLTLINKYTKEIYISPFTGQTV